MSQCKGVVEEVEKISKIIDFKVSKAMAECIAVNTESFITNLLEDSLNVCINDKRKIVTVEDVKDAIYERKTEFLKPLFD